MSDGTPIIIVKKKVHGGHAHHGGSWKVAYADFVTAMMAFFMVMWIMGLSDQTRAQIAGYFNDPLGFKANVPHSRQIVSPKAPPASSPKNRKDNQGAGEAAQKEKEKIKQLQKKLKSELENDLSLSKLMKGIEMTITEEGLRIELVESKDAAFFETGSAVLNPLAYRVIGKLAPIIRGSHRSIILEGHTDSAQYAGQDYTNWDLSGDRANALRRALFKAGIEPHQLKAVRALADTQLKFPANPTDERNRRVTILLPFKDLSADDVKLPTDDLTSRPPDVSLEPPTVNK
jgi:chemotaxis protein MotB